MNQQREAVPPCWPSRLAQIEERLAELSSWHVRQICRSAGGRPVWACTRGPRREVARTANFSAAWGADCAEAFAGDAGPPQCFLYLTGVHGAEMEGPVAAVNFMHLMEHGTDLDGGGWPDLRDAAEGMRLVVVPVANPDGRARVEPDSLVGLGLEDLRYWGQGRWRDGELIGYPDCKRWQPLPMDDCEFPGGYPNDDGYNLMHDVIPGDIRTAEVRALLKLAREETVDCVLNAHSYELSPGVLASSLVLEGYAEQQRRLSGAIEAALAERGLRPRDYYESSTWNLVSAIHLATGALGVVFEGPHGLESNPYSHRQILHCHLSALEGALTFGAANGFRPRG